MRVRKGFTLVELLVVVLILGALAAIAIPRISQSADSAKKNACRTNVDLINSQVELYYANNDGNWPSSLDTFLKDKNFFPDGEPTCPVDGSAYTWDKNHHVAEHTHK